MPGVELKVSIKLAWWVRHYVASVALFAQLTGLNPDPVKVEYWVSKGVSIKVQRNEV